MSGGSELALYEQLRGLSADVFGELRYRVGLRGVDVAHLSTGAPVPTQAQQLLGLCRGAPERFALVQETLDGLLSPADPRAETDALRAWLAWAVGWFDRVPGFGQGEQDAQEHRLSKIYVRLLHRPIDTDQPTTKRRARQALLGRPDPAMKSRPHDPAPPEGALDACEDGSTEPTLEALIDAMPTGRWTLQGDPGSGKSTLLRRLAVQRAAAALACLEAGETLPAASVPILVELSALDERGRTLFEQAAAAFAGWKPEAAARVPGALEALVEGGQAVLLFDGMDEVRPDTRGDVRQRLADWSAVYRRCPVVMTSRRFGYTRPSGDFVELELLPLSAERQQELLGRRLPPARVDEVLRQIAGHPPMQDMAGNPFMLTLMAALAREEPGPLPTRRLALYQRVLGHLVNGRLRGERTRQLDATPAQLREGLGELALALLQESAGPWTRAELEGHFQQTGWKVVERLPEKVEGDTGLIVPLDARATGWRFLHRSFLECLAAEALHRREQGRGLWKFAAPLPLLGRWLSPYPTVPPEQVGRWAEVFALLAGMDDEPLVFLQQLRRIQPALALRALANVEDIPAAALVAEFGAGSAQGLIRELMARVGDREQLAQRLVRLGREIEEVETRQLIGAALWAIGADGVHLDALRAVADGAGTLGIPERPWVAIPGGTFWMGSPEGVGFDDEHPRHAVRVSGFEMLSVPVTQALYEVVTGERPSHFGDDLRRPVETVSWFDAVRFCNALSLLRGLPLAYQIAGEQVTRQPVSTGCRLPTEAEWEYACRAGTSTAYWSGDEERDLARVGWYGANSRRSTHPVGEKAANPWGLFDVHGNVWEWCWDWYGFYTDAPQTDPQGSLSGTYRVVRGGSWYYSADVCRSACRSWYVPGVRDSRLGFRVVCSSAPAEP